MRGWTFEDDHSTVRLSAIRQCRKLWKTQEAGPVSVLLKHMSDIGH